MKSFKETLAALKRRVDDNTDPVPESVVIDKLAADFGVTKEALVWGLGLGKKVLGGLAAGAEKGIGAAASNPVRAIEVAMIGHQAKGEADKYNKMVTPKFPRMPRGVGLHD